MSSADRNTGPSHEAPANLGARLRDVRLEAGLSLREVARQLSVSPSFVSQLENGKSHPSVVTLYAMSQLLNVSIDALFSDGHSADVSQDTTDAPAERVPGAVDPSSVSSVSRSDLGSPVDAWPRDQGSPRFSLTRPGDRRRLVMHSGVMWDQLVTNAGSELEFIEVHYPAHSSSTNDARMLRHDGYEYGYLLEGELEITLGFDAFTLRPGEAVGFDSSIPHLLSNRGDVPVRGIWFVRHSHA